MDGDGELSDSEKRRERKQKRKEQDAARWAEIREPNFDPPKEVPAILVSGTSYERAIATVKKHFGRDRREHVQRKNPFDGLLHIISRIEERRLLPSVEKWILHRHFKKRPETPLTCVLLVDRLNELCATGPWEAVAWKLELAVSKSWINWEYPTTSEAYIDEFGSDEDRGWTFAD